MAEIWHNVLYNQTQDKTSVIYIKWQKQDFKRWLGRGKTLIWGGGGGKASACPLFPLPLVPSLLNTCQSFSILWNRAQGHTKKSRWNKSPRGLNAHLNWRKLPVVHLGVCHQLEKLWGPSPGPHGAMCTIWTILNPLLQRMCFELDETVTFLGPLPEPITPPPPPPPPPAHCSHPGNCHEQL